MAGPTGSDGLVVQRAEVDQIVCHDRTALGASDLHDLRVGERLVGRVAIHGLDIVAALPQSLRHIRREHLVE